MQQAKLLKDTDFISYTLYKLSY